MPLLDRHGSRADAYIRPTADGTIDAACVLVPWVDLPDVLERLSDGRAIGVEVPNTLAAAALLRFRHRLNLVAVRFPAFSDGRGFSLARQLRNGGFRATLRAVGPLIADQFAYALACGFDEVEIPDAVAERQPVAQWIAAASSISAGYQRGYGDAGNILERRRAAQAATGSAP